MGKVYFLPQDIQNKINNFKKYRIIKTYILYILSEIFKISLFPHLEHKRERGLALVPYQVFFCGIGRGILFYSILFLFFFLFICFFFILFYFTFSFSFFLFISFYCLLFYFVLLYFCFFLFLSYLPLRNQRAKFVSNNNSLQVSGFVGGIPLPTLDSKS